MVSFPYETKPGFCFYHILVLSRKICPRVSQNLDNISFTSNYIKYLGFTAVSNVLIIVLKMEDIYKKFEVTHIWYLFSLLVWIFKKKTIHDTQLKHLFQFNIFLLFANGVFLIKKL